MQQRTILLTWLCILAIVGVAQKSPVFVQSGKAINGYDAVSYFTKSKPVQGDDKLVYTWNGAKWYFESAENLTAFKKNPDRYAPQYGGYCAYGMANGYKAPTEKEQTYLKTFADNLVEGIEYYFNLFRKEGKKITNSQTTIKSSLEDSLQSLKLLRLKIENLMLFNIKRQSDIKDFVEVPFKESALTNSKKSVIRFNQL